MKTASMTYADMVDSAILAGVNHYRVCNSMKALDYVPVDGVSIMIADTVIAALEAAKLESTVKALYPFAKDASKWLNFSAETEIVEPFPDLEDNSEITVKNLRDAADVFKSVLGLKGEAAPISHAVLES